MVQLRVCPWTMKRHGVCAASLQNGIAGTQSSLGTVLGAGFQTERGCVEAEPALKPIVVEMAVSREALRIWESWRDRGHELIEIRPAGLIGV